MKLFGSSSGLMISFLTLCLLQQQLRVNAALLDNNVDEKFSSHQNSASPISSLDKFQKKFVSASHDCHSIIRDHLTDSVSSIDEIPPCQNECMKLFLSLVLANCLLSHQSFLPIDCDMESIQKHDCTLNPSCLNEDNYRNNHITTMKKHGHLTSSSLQQSYLLNSPQPQTPKFNQPNQQSIVFTQAYGYIDELCTLSMSVNIMESGVEYIRASNEATKETLSLLNNIQITTSNSYKVLTNIENISLVTLKNSETTLDNSEILLGISREHLDISIKTGTLLAETSTSVRENIKLTQEVKVASEKHHEMLQQANAKIDQANNRLQESVNLIDIIKINIILLEEILIRILRICSVLFAVAMLCTLLAKKRYFYWLWPLLKKNKKSTSYGNSPPTTTTICSSGSLSPSQQTKPRQSTQQELKHKVKHIMSHNKDIEGVIWLNPVQKTVYFEPYTTSEENIGRPITRLLQQRHRCLRDDDGLISPKTASPLSSESHQQMSSSSSSIMGCCSPQPIIRKNQAPKRGINSDSHVSFQDQSRGTNKKPKI